MRQRNTTKTILKSCFTACLMLVCAFGYTQSSITLSVQNMTPHLGQKFEARIVDMNTGEEVGRYETEAIANAAFNVDFLDLTDGHTYQVDFYADMNENGIYDDPPTDHAWRETVENLDGNTIIDWVHTTTNFEFIDWKYAINLDVLDITPHIGQMFQARVVNSTTGKEVSRQTIESIANANFQMTFGNIEAGEDYKIEFYADFNENGHYDAPPTDHAWSEDITDVQGNVDVEWTHNTNFTDIMWPYKVSLYMQNLDPHLGQMFEARLISTANSSMVDEVTITSIDYTSIKVSLIGAEIDGEYNLDFYADLNENMAYDAPPTDHAWRETLTINGDTTIMWMHNISFTDIMWKASAANVALKEYELRLYPNPVKNGFTVSINKAANISVTIADVTGKTVSYTSSNSMTEQLRITGLEELDAGVYYVTVTVNNKAVTMPILKK